MRSKRPRAAFVTIACTSAACIIGVSTSTAHANPPPPGRRGEEAPHTATPAQAIEVWEGYGCYASWSDGGWVHVDCPPELAKLNNGSMQVAPDGKDCIVVPGDVRAPCPAVLTEPAVPGEQPPPSSGKARACGRCEVGAHDDRKDTLVVLVTMMCCAAVGVVRRTRR